MGKDPQKEIKTIKEELEAAISHREFVPHFLPAVDVLTGEICGAELLVRWNHWLDGLRMPAEFIADFERVGCISDLDIYMFEEACRIINRNQLTPLSKLKFAINFSPMSLMASDISQRLLDIAAKYDIKSDFPILEIPFNILRDYKCCEQIKKMIDKGFDFTAYNFDENDSFDSEVDILNICAVKFDKDFVQDAVADVDKQDHLGWVCDKCTEIGRRPMVVGIENSTAEDVIRKCRIRMAQGYYYSRPIPEEDFIKFYLSSINDENVEHVDVSEFISFNSNNEGKPE